jgi:hypothetical protein
MVKDVTPYWKLLNAILDQACKDCNIHPYFRHVRKEARDWIKENGVLWAVILGYTKADIKRISKLSEEVTEKK